MNYQQIFPTPRCAFNLTSSHSTPIMAQNSLIYCMKTIALIPAYNASKTIRGVVERIPRDIVQEVLIVNDGSTDRTLEVLRDLHNVQIITHDKNKGYGAAQKTLYKTALTHPHDFTVILHADGGHFPEEISLLLEPMKKGIADIVIGSRIRGILKTTSPLLGSRFLGAMFQSTMPRYKFLANVALTNFQNLLLGTHYYSFHCGFRACSRKILEAIDWDFFSDWYLFDMEFLVYAHRAQKKILEVPVGTFYDQNAGSSVPSIRYGLKTLGFSLKQSLNRFTSKPL